MFLNNWQTFVFSLHSPQIQLPQWDQVVAFHLTLATDLHLQAFKISTCVSWDSHTNFNRKKKNITKKTKFIEHVLHKHLSRQEKKKKSLKATLRKTI